MFAVALLVTLSLTATCIPIACDNSASACPEPGDHQSLLQRERTLTVSPGPLPANSPAFSEEGVFAGKVDLSLFGAKDSLGGSQAFCLTASLNIAFFAIIVGICRRGSQSSGGENGKPMKVATAAAVNGIAPQNAAALICETTRPMVVSDISSDVLELAQAVRAGDAVRCTQLLENHKGLVKKEDHFGCSALHVAAGCGSAALTRLLLDFGASVDARDTWEETALHFAARAGGADACEELLSYGAAIDAVNSDGDTPLLLAARAGERGACEFLLARDAGLAGLADEELPPLLSELLVRRIFGDGGSAGSAGALPPQGPEAC